MYIVLLTIILIMKHVLAQYNITTDLVRMEVWVWRTASNFGRRSRNGSDFTLNRLGMSFIIRKAGY